MASIYCDNTYASHNPDWHSADSPWKARRIVELLRRNGAAYRRVAEVGCGTGGVLAGVVAQSGPECSGDGFDIAGAVIKRAKTLENERLRYHCEDFLRVHDNYDLLLLIDVVEHVENYLGFMTALRDRARMIVVHLPLEMHVSAVTRDSFDHARASVGHLHFFTLGTALASFEHAGYRVKDHQMTRGVLELSSANNGRRTQLANVARRAVETFSLPLAARLLGGYSVLALLEPAGSKMSG